MTLKLSQLFWIALLACILTVLGSGHAEAKTSLASWYGPSFKGLPTASGEPYDPSGYTAAHKRLPLGTELVVSYRGRSARVMVNDRGPYVGQRKLDLSKGAAKYLGLKRAGVDYVDYTVVGDSAYGDNYGSYSAGYSTTTDSSAGTGYSTNSQTVSYSSGAQASPGGGTYVVQPGDTLSELALQLGTTVEYLAAANSIENPDLLYSGQTIYY
jgi:rare lipoprotein A